MVQFVEGMALYETLTQKGFLEDARYLSGLEQELYKSEALSKFTEWLKLNGFNYNLRFATDSRHSLEFSENSSEFFLPFTSGAPKSAKELLLVFIWLRSLLPRTTFLYIRDFDNIAFGISADVVLTTLFKQRNVQAVIVTHNTHLVRTSLVRPDTCFLKRDNKLMPLFEPMTKEIREAQNLEKMYWDGSFDEA